MYLQTLNLSKNALSHLSDDFGELKCLEELNLASNQITQLPLCLTKLKQLKRLDLSENCLIHLAMLPKHMKVSLLPCPISPLFSCLSLSPPVPGGPSLTSLCSTLLVLCSCGRRKICGTRLKMKPQLR
jgi:Leucine-rich repeat (LRR) protein